jgi:hypothetical protein
MLQDWAEYPGGGDEDITHVVYHGFGSQSLAWFVEWEDHASHTRPNYVQFLSWLEVACWNLVLAYQADAESCELAFNWENAKLKQEISATFAKIHGEISEMRVLLSCLERS